MKKIISIILALLVISTSVFAQKKTVVTVEQDENGWRLIDRGNPVEVKGVVWSFTPIGQTHTYDLFAQDEDFIRKMIDTDMPLLKKMGVNTIRCFTMIPPKWVDYIYTKYGIYSIINDTLGRYGVTVKGTWNANTDYSDLYTREVLIEQARQTAEKYKDTKGVLMYLFGNESNYGLVWSSNEIENLPTGEKDIVKAGYLYDLMEKAMAACKEVDPNRPVGIVNGDTQYLDLIAKLCPSLDILGINAYRGYKFYDSFYQNVQEVLNKPIVFTEAGADAFNDILMQEDQVAQMNYLKSQWEEIYRQAYGKGNCQNVLGGVVFEWMDEWWKRYQNKNLEVHDGASWSSSAYDVDYKDGVNNMSEEWFGICAQSPLKEDGINIRIPRASYYMLKDIWKLSLYDSETYEIDQTFDFLEDGLYLALGNEKSIKQTIRENKVASISQAELNVVSTTPVSIDKLKENADRKTTIKNATRYANSKGETLETKVAAEGLLGITLNPVENLTGDFVIKAWTDEPFTKFHNNWTGYYENELNSVGGETHLKYVDLYSGSFSYDNSAFTLNGYYHTGHAGFEGKGDIFNISKEAFDIIGYDTYGSKAPIAVEFVGKNTLEGLEVIGGPEIWGAAKPQIQANYFKWIPFSNGIVDGIVLNATYAEEFGHSENINLDPYNGFGPGRKASVYFESFFNPWLTFKAGGLFAGSEKLGATYTKGNGQLAKITYADTLGGYVQIGTNMFQHAYIYANGIYRGLVAQTNAQAVRGSFFTADSGSGNRMEMQVGADLVYGNFTFKPVMRMRKPLEKAIGRKLTAGSPFVVDMGNRQSVEFEGVFTYDPEGATWFHEWNSDDIEGAPFAFSVTGLYQLFAGKTDSLPFRSSDKATYSRNDETSATKYAWYEGGALPLQNNLFQVGTRIVCNPTGNLRIIANVYGGHLGATTGAYVSAGTSEFVDFVRAELALRYRNWIFQGALGLNAWGEEEWWRNFNQTFPLQYSLDIAYGFDKPAFGDAKNRIGMKVQGCTFGDESSDAYLCLPNGLELSGANYLEASLYFNIGLK